MEKNLSKALEERILGILEEEKIIIPSDFMENLQKNAEMHFEGKISPICSIRAVIRMCNYWRRFCADENEFSKLVCTEIYSMVRIHAAAVTSNKGEGEYYLTNICKLKEGIFLPENTTTTASYTGDSVAFQGFGAVVRKI